MNKDFITSFYFSGHNYFYIYGHIWGTTVDIIINTGNKKYSQIYD